MSFLAKVEAAHQLPSLGKYPMIVAYMLDSLNTTPDPNEMTPYDLEEFIEEAASELNIELDLHDDSDLDIDVEEDDDDESGEEKFEASPVAKQIHADYLKAYNFQQTLPADARDAYAYLYLVVDVESSKILAGGCSKEDLKEDVKDYRSSGQKTKIVSRAKIKPDAFTAFFNANY